MLLNNANIRIEEANLGGESCNILVPLLPNKCWTVSQIISIGPMLREEIRREKLGLIGMAFQLASFTFEFFGRIAKIDKAVFPNSFGFSTNLYEKGQLKRILANCATLKTKYKDCAIIIKSINLENFDYKSLTKYKHLPTRIIFYSNDIMAKVSPRSDTKSDNAEFENSGLKWAQYNGAIEAAKLKRIIALYRQLYLEKYSTYNPDYSEEYLLSLLKRRIINFKCLENSGGEILGFCTYYSTNTELCSPMIGYDESYKSAPIYRIIMNEAANVALLANKSLNHSAGAAKYKSNRGFTPLVEYMLIIDDHLPWWRRLGYTIISEVFKKFEKQLLKAVIS